MQSTSINRPQCLCLGTDPLRLEAYPGPPAYQPCRYICSLVSLGAEIRRWLWSPRYRRLLLRGGERLVDLEALEEAHPEYHHDSCMAPELSATCCWLYRLPRARLLQLYQGYRYPSRAQRLGRAPPLQHYLW